MNESLKKEIGITIRNIRKSKLLTVLDVENNTNISKDAIYKMEQGKSNSLKTLLKLLDYYDIKYNIFFKQVYDNCHN